MFRVAARIEDEKEGSDMCNILYGQDSTTPFWGMTYSNEHAETPNGRRVD
jgi:uncharacterized protein YpmB